MDLGDVRARELQRSGKSNYHQQDYRSALSNFTDALKHAKSNAIRVGILDNRAAVLEKIGPECYKAALQDAHKMIKLQQTSPRGYLRAGKVLQLLGKFQQAIVIYKAGLERHHEGDEEGRKLLLGMHRKTTELLRNAARPKSADIMFALPYELVDMILKYLPYRSLIRSQRVCKSWREFLMSYPQSYSTLDFSAAVKPVSKLTIKTYLKRSRGAVTKVNLHRVAFSDPETLYYMAKLCRDLEEVSVMGSSFVAASFIRFTELSKNLKVLEIGTPTSFSAVFDIIKNGKSLESLTCHDVEGFGDASDIREERKLRRLIVTGNSSKLARVMVDLKNLPYLRYLELRNMQTVRGSISESELETLCLSRVFLEDYPNPPPTVRRLDLSKNPNLFLHSGDIEKWPLPNLESLNLSECPRITASNVQQLLSASEDNKTLRSLNLSMCQGVETSNLEWLTESSHAGGLVDFSLRGCVGFDDQVSKELKALRSLETFDMSDTMISGVGIINIVHREGSRLRWIGLDFCDNIGWDALEHIKKLGLKVSNQRQRKIAGGRRIRY